MKHKVVNIELEDDYRIVAISDVHGHNDVFKELLDKVKLREDDYLVILGDFINKGIDSYETLESMKELMKRKNTIILKGNHEMNIERIMAKKEKFVSIDDFLENEYYETLIHSMMRNSDLKISDFNSLEDLYSSLIEMHNKDFKFISELPIYASIDDYIFVHGGYEKAFESEDEKKYLKYDYFNKNGPACHKNVVVGHWPACNLRTDKISNDPYFNHEKNFISIDGGIGVHETGELNAFIIEKKNGLITYNSIQHNNFKKVKISKKHIFEKEKSFYVNFSDNDFDVIKRGELMTTCLHKSSNMKFSVFNSLIHENDKKFSLKMNYYNNFLNLEKGDEVKLVKTFEDCNLVKFQGEFGWLLKDQII